MGGIGSSNNDSDRVWASIKRWGCRVGVFGVLAFAARVLYQYPNQQILFGSGFYTFILVGCFSTVVGGLVGYVIASSNK